MDISYIYLEYMDWLVGGTDEQRQKDREKRMERFQSENLKERQDLNALREWVCIHR